MYLHKTQQPTAQLFQIPDGPGGIEATLNLMRDLVRVWKKEQKIRRCALDLTGHLDQKDFDGEVKAIFEFVRDEIRYVMDICDVETVHSPDVVLDQGSGDCDDKCVCLAALLESIGHPTRFVAIGYGADYEHVYCEAQLHGEWVALETTEPVEMGWRPPRARLTMVSSQ